MSSYESGSAYGSSDGSYNSGSEDRSSESMDADNVPIEALEDDEEKNETAVPTKKEKKPTIGFFKLFRYSTAADKLILFWAVLMALGSGALQPLSSILLGDVINSFGSTGEQLVANVSNAATYYGILAAVAMFCGFFQTWGFSFTARRQAHVVRQQYFRAVMRQEMGWFDSTESGVITTRGSGDIVLIEDAMGDKVGLVLQCLSVFITGFIIAFTYSWKMSLVCLALVPLLIMCSAAYGFLLAKFSARTQEAYAKAGAVAEEVISSIRTVMAFGGQQREDKRFASTLVAALNAGTKKGYVTGIVIGLIFLVMFGSYGLAFWYGATLIDMGELTPGRVVTCFFSLLIGSMSMGQVAPNMTAIASGRGAAFEVFAMIDRESKIDSSNPEGKKLKKYKGNISFKRVSFEYPTRQGQTILNKLSIEIEAGSTVAIVGPSGSGKSTVVQLIERFYDPDAGTVLLDGTDVRDLSLPWWREQIGIVSQEPVLFAASIMENIRYGRLDATDEDIIAAAKMANAHQFIVKLPSGYNTGVGERGGQLSGGQKQRIAIARALVRNPKILLLDEATSALDNRAERIVQDALDKASKGRTTVVIAHRLSTIRDADKIIVLKDGQVAEQGTHDELYAEDGIYKAMVDLQKMKGSGKGGKSSRSAGKSSRSAGKSSAKSGRSARQSATLSSSASGSYIGSSASGSGDSDDESAGSAEEDFVGLSLSKEEMEKQKKDEEAAREAEETVRNPMWRAIKLNASEWPFLLIGLLGACAAGCAFPVYSLIFSNLVQDIILLRGAALMTAAAKWAAVFTGLGGALFIAQYLQNAMFTISGERLTDRIRRLLFTQIIRQEVAWFDEPAHQTGALSTKLSTSAALVQGATGQQLGLMAQLCATLVSGLVIAFIACWQLALVTVACVPLIVFSGMVQMQQRLGHSHKSKTAYEKAGAVQSECVMAIRTVAGLGREATFIERYEAELLFPYKKEVRGSFLNGLGFGFGQACTFAIFGLTFWYGSTLVRDGHAGIGDMFKAIMAILFGAQGTGRIATMAPDLDKAKRAAAEIFALQDREPPINATDGVGEKFSKTKGALELDGVVFKYAQRPNQVILKGVNLSIEPGKTVALVGPSGCGKSTVIQLLERFYDPLEGTVRIDGRDMRDIDVQDLRKLVGLVQQEPVLFNTTIRDNILYGKPDATEAEVLAASKSANLHEFVTKLRDGYDTVVGPKGSKLSGGQKQRVAIARALIRNPKILLLDEATSALDTKAERLVQDALDKARKGRTTVVVAHRLSTIQDSDVIVAMEAGQVKEMGTHEELMASRGIYYNMVISRAET